jgi:signal transduction histidine kinase
MIRAALEPSASSNSWFDAISGQPVDAVVLGLLLVCAAVLGGVALRPLTRRTRSLHHLVLAISMSSLAVGAVVAVLLARLMVLDAAEARTAIAVLAVTAAFAAILAVIASSPLSRDAASLESAVRRLEEGDRTVRTGVRRADELGHVALALDELTQQLDRLERERDSVEAERRLMLSSISHDMRTPLAALRAAVEALVDGVAPDPPRYLNSMAREVAALSALVDDVFLLARIESGRLDLSSERVDLADLADDAVEALRPAALSRSVTVRLTASDVVAVDGNAPALGRVIRNLLDNAIQHSPEGSFVDVEVTAGDAAGLRVIDQGPGFEATFADHAFERFTRPDHSRHRGTGGAGLGLAIARGLIEAQGGRIRIEPPPGGRVAFELPMSTATDWNAVPSSGAGG